MSLRAIVGITALVLVIGFLAFEVWTEYSRKSVALSSYEELERSLNAARLETQRLKGEVNFYGSPENIEKEARARFNYKRVDEGMLILVPVGTTTSEKNPKH